MDELDLTFVDQAIDEIGAGAENLLMILQAVQGHFGYLPEEALERICEVTQITPASIAGVSTFYDHFRHRPAQSAQGSGEPLCNGLSGKTGIPRLDFHRLAPAPKHAAGRGMACYRHKR